MALPVQSGGDELSSEIVRLLSEADDGLSDGELTRALEPTRRGIRPQRVNLLCRRMVAEGLLERVGNRPIRNRLVAVHAPPTLVRSPAPPEDDDTVDTGSSAVDDAVSPTDAPAEALVDPLDAEPVAARGPAPDDTVARSSTEDPDPDPSTAEAAPEPVPVAPPESDPAPVAEPEPQRETRTFPRRRTVAPPPPVMTSQAPAVPTRDVTQGWSRTVNVTAAVANWLVRHGAVIRTATTDDGPARDLVAALDGDVVHVEVTGWPPDGARTHPTTLAGDWFSAAASAAAMRRQAHPRARIVIALPETRRYRALAQDRAAALAGCGTEVWFVDASGAVRPH